MSDSGTQKTIRPAPSQVGKGSLYIFSNTFKDDLLLQA